MPTPDRLRAQAEALTAVWQAAADREQAATTLKAAVRAAVNLDVPRADIATAADVHRSTVNEWAKEEGQ